MKKIKRRTASLVERNIQGEKKRGKEKEEEEDSKKRGEKNIRDLKRDSELRERNGVSAPRSGRIGRYAGKGNRRWKNWLAAVKAREEREKDSRSTQNVQKTQWIMAKQTARARARARSRESKRADLRRKSKTLVVNTFSRGERRATRGASALRTECPWKRGCDTRTNGKRRRVPRKNGDDENVR